MLYFLKNKQLQVAIEGVGGEILSMKTLGDSKEFIWQGDAKYWTGHAPNLFPFVGRLTKGCYKYREKLYSMGIHGFLGHQELTCVEQTQERLVLGMNDNQETRACFPFAFTFHLTYEISEQTLTIRYEVTNTGNDVMFFGIGGHPGFNVPFDADKSFAEHFLEFASETDVQEIVMTSDCFLSGERKKFPLEKGLILPLRHELFDNDAIVLANVSSGVSLRCNNSPCFVRLKYPQMPYLGLWHAPKTDAPYICIEPWQSLPSEKNRITDLEEKTDLEHLQPGHKYMNTWSIECGVL